jgi:hypothetical protein
VTAEDELYVASLAVTRDLKLVDLTHLLYEENVIRLGPVGFDREPRRPEDFSKEPADA